MATEVGPVGLLAPFFKGEGGYCQLLQVLLTADTVLARSFRRAFCEKVLGPRLKIRIDENPLEVRREVTVHPPGEASQTIDLVMYLGNDVLAMETKVFAASARKGQLRAQYRGLRNNKISQNKNVHMLFISPVHSSQHHEVEKERDGDQAGSITWGEVFACFPPTNSIEPDVFLGSLMREALVHFADIQNRAPKTLLTIERRAVKDEMKESIKLFNGSLRDNDGILKGCFWEPHFWRGPTVDSYYGPLTSSDGKPRKGQNMVMEAYYKEGETLISEEGIRICVGFRLERRGGVRTYRTEFEVSREANMNRLSFSVGQPKLDEGGCKVFNERWIRVNGDQVSELAGRPVSVILADLLFAYATVFSDFLLRDGLPVRIRDRSPKEPEGGTSNQLLGSKDHAEERS